MFDQLLSRALRRSSRYDIVVADRLTAEERQALAGLAAAPDFYGILRPRLAAAGGSVKAVDQDTALLLLTLTEAAPLPEFARRRLGGGAAETVARLVADGALEVEIDGEFLSGAQALRRLPRSPAMGSRSRLARLSDAALASASELDRADLAKVSRHLYAAHRLPLSRAWRERFPDAGAVLGDLQSGMARGQRAALDRDWRPTLRTAHWLHWRNRREAAREPHEGCPTYKLYLSPLPADLPAVWAVAMEALAVAACFELKVGAAAPMLLRPDKLVAYFAGLSDLVAAAERLGAELQGLSPHGVPFTADLGGDGLLSWGLDAASGPWRGVEGDSWRHWIALQLAQSLIAARTDKLEAAEATEFALARLRLSGVDPATWAPTAGLRREWGG